MSAGTVRSLAHGILKGEITALAEGITLLEEKAPVGIKLLSLLKTTSRRTNSGFAIGVTGAPGSGKSTLIAGLGSLMRRMRKKVAILAVDPSSPKTGGAFLGDRVRMQELAEDENVFIRSMASRGTHGGVARSTKDAAFLFLKAGYDLVFIETVGAGQLDYGVTQCVDLTLLVLTPESGDEMQFLKAGLAELADAFVVNKSDRPGAKVMEDLLRRSFETSRFPIPIFRTIAEQRKGLEPLYRFILGKCAVTSKG